MKEGKQKLTVCYSSQIAYSNYLGYSEVQSKVLQREWEGNKYLVVLT